jgi:hypothetical protein
MSALSGVQRSSHRSNRCPTAQHRRSRTDIFTVPARPPMSGGATSLGWIEDGSPCRCPTAPWRPAADWPGGRVSGQHVRRPARFYGEAVLDVHTRCPGPWPRARGRGGRRASAIWYRSVGSRAPLVALAVLRGPRLCFCQSGGRRPEGRPGGRWRVGAGARPRAAGSHGRPAPTWLPSRCRSAGEGPRILVNNFARQ